MYKFIIISNRCIYMYFNVLQRLKIHIQINTVYTNLNSCINILNCVLSFKIENKNANCLMVEIVFMMALTILRKSH